jgi:D-glycerate 3-kinase
MSFQSCLPSGPLSVSNWVTSEENASNKIAQFEQVGCTQKLKNLRPSPGEPSWQRPETKELKTVPMGFMMSHFAHSVVSTRQSLLDQLGTSPDTLRRVDDYYLPVFQWCADVVQQLPSRPVRVGLNGPQGCGKSTLVEHAVKTLAAWGIRAVAVSIDDFYLTYSQQRALAERHPGNRYTEFRGYPGTHDVSLGARVLDALASPAPQSVRTPVYDKAAHQGRGDRVPEALFRSVNTPLDLVFLEGWMLGFTPVDSESLTDPDLAVVNNALGDYSAWIERLDAFIHLDAHDPNFVIDWRIDAERARRAAGAAGLTDEQARDYVLRFIPAYQTWGQGLREHLPVNGPWLRVTLGNDRLPRVGSMEMGYSPRPR